MPIPTYDAAMFPLLRSLADGQPRHVRDLTESVAQAFNLTEEERSRLLPGGGQTVIRNRVGWSRTYLSKAELIDRTARGIYQINARGQQVLAQNPDGFDNNVLRQFPEFVEWIDAPASVDAQPVAKAGQPDQTPEEALERSYSSIRQALAAEVLENVMACSPAFFERLVVELLVRMGYGGSREDAGQAIGRSGDGGIDGIIKEDRLGLDVIYLQAKRWEATIGRPELHKFAGALQGRRAKKGVFITTSDFTKDAREYVSAIDNKIILIDGNELADYMIDFNVGVSPLNTYEIKRMDSDYFIEE